MTLFHLEKSIITPLHNQLTTYPMAKIVVGVLILAATYLLGRKLMEPEPMRRPEKPGPNRLFLAGMIVVLLAVLAYMALADKTLASNPSTPAVTSSAEKTLSDTPAAVTGPQPDVGPNDDLQAQVDRLYTKRGIEAIETKLNNRSIDALKAFPANDGRNVAEVLSARRVAIASNSFVDCNKHVKIVSSPGCLVTVFLTRIPPAQQTDLSGVRAEWFIGLDDHQFRPVNGWAVHVTNDDDWLVPGGALDQADTR